jgi:hypothetical protein
MDLFLINQADRALSSCGARPIIRDGSVVPLYKSFLMPMLLQPGQTVNFLKEITGDALWELRAISSDQGSNSVVGARIQIQLPTGRFLFGGNGMDVGQFAWVGSYRYLMDPPEECEPGSKIQVTLSDYTGLSSQIAVNLLFEGAYKFYLKGGQIQKRLPSAQSIPRYQGIVNENRLAPCWMGGYGPSTPKGYRDDRFTYASGNLATPYATVPLAGPLTATLSIPIDRGLDFVCRRIFFDVQQDSTVTSGRFLGRIRTGNGYALNDNFFDLPQLISGAAYPHDWIIRGGDQVFMDIVLADFAGTGNMYIQAFLEGAKRHRL